MGLGAGNLNLSGPLPDVALKLESFDHTTCTCEGVAVEVCTTK